MSGETGSSKGPDGWMPLFALIVSALPIGIGYALSAPLIAIVLERADHSGAVIGNNAAMFPIAVLLIGGAIPILAARVGAYGIMLGAVGLASAALLMFPAFQSLEAWFLLRFLLGIGIGAHWIVSESCINLLVAAEDRGKVLGVYVTILALGIVLGPSILALAGTEGSIPFLIGGAVMAGAGLPLLLVTPRWFRMPSHPGLGLWKVGLRYPIIMITGFASGFLEATATNLLPIFGLRAGLVAETATLLLAAFVAGNLVFQIPIGWLADRADRRALLIACAAGAAALAFGVPQLVGGPMLWAVLVPWGGLVFGFYTLGLTELGARVPAAAMAAANAAFVMAYQVGTLAGPSLTGRAMDHLGPNAMPYACAVLCCVFAMIVLIRSRGR